LFDFHQLIYDLQQLLYTGNLCPPKGEKMSAQYNVANPSALGLLGFGMTTVILALHNLGLFGLDSTILAMGIFYGGAAQVIAGIMEFKRNNMFGATAFTSYGLFWIALVTVKTGMMGSFGFVSDPNSMTAFFFLWGMLTLVFFVGTLRGGKSLQVVFLTLTTLFFVLAVGTYLDSEITMRIAGVVGVICGGSAFYTASAEILNDKYEEQKLPL